MLYLKLKSHGIDASLAEVNEPRSLLDVVHGPRCCSLLVVIRPSVREDYQKRPHLFLRPIARSCFPRISKNGLYRYATASMKTISARFGRLVRNEPWPFSVLLGSWRV